MIKNLHHHMDKLLYKKNTQNIDKQYKQNKME